MFSIDTVGMLVPMLYDCKTVVFLPSKISLLRSIEIVEPRALRASMRGEKNVSPQSYLRHTHSLQIFRFNTTRIEVCFPVYCVFSLALPTHTHTQP